MKKEKLREELIRLKDTGKSRIMKKYNLSIYEIHLIEDLLDKKYSDFISFQVASCLMDYGYSIQNYGVGFRLV